MFDSVMKCMLMLHYNLQVDESVHKWPLPFVRSISSSSCIVKLSSKVSHFAILNVIMYNIIFLLHSKTILQSLPICYSKCHNVDVFHLKELLLLTNEIILTVSRRDTETCRHLV